MVLRGVGPMHRFMRAPASALAVNNNGSDEHVAFRCAESGYNMLRASGCDRE